MDHGSPASTLGERVPGASLLICSVCSTGHAGIRSYARRIFAFAIRPKAPNPFHSPPASTHTLPRPMTMKLDLVSPSGCPLLACALDSLIWVYSNCCRRADSSSSRQAMASTRPPRSFSSSAIWAVHFASDCRATEWEEGVAGRIKLSPFQRSTPTTRPQGICPFPRTHCSQMGPRWAMCSW